MSNINQPIMHAREPLHGAEGAAYATIEGSRYLLFQLKNFEGNWEKGKSEIPRLGTRKKGNRSNTLSGKWSADLYYNTDVFRKLIMVYAKTGRDIYFDIQITNDDPNSNAGRHTAIFRDCNIDGAVMAKLDITADTLEEKISGTFEDCDMPEEFNVLEGMI
ncbi:Phage tail tube protein [Peptoniphilus asaccharolyticus DSM 20463]|uniref:PBSX prophage protein n=3 Tax=Peptoniphilus TaxID=162289 RepID=G4D5G7_9FIRM|nr:MULTISPECIES: phage tail tube protein [Peptoniphilus]EGY79013.1 PBSX prophage protein [Peptoniphilus indolicus ATCC 29427]MBL7575519.1 phage tail tube protein [Peptoniphilus asaccharolyticus]MDY2987687.1 phage tail tube protein [Peptoniphilus sp.]SMB87127.1 Phage tail tube protein [Peptoniphilus asaccharolyticus DSM 20463]SUB74383.1 Phage-like element PBSX protein xkdM [Peptoniphilus indolicus]